MSEGCVDLQGSCDEPCIERACRRDRCSREDAQQCVHPPGIRSVGFSSAQPVVQGWTRHAQNPGELGLVERQRRLELLHLFDDRERDGLAKAARDRASGMMPTHGEPTRLAAGLDASEEAMTRNEVLRLLRRHKATLAGASA